MLLTPSPTTPGASLPTSLQRLEPVALLVAVALVTAALVTGVAPSAQAHNVLRSSDPKDGATVPAPAQVSLTFDQSVQTLGTAVQVDGPKGSLELDPVVVDGQTVVQPLPDRLAAGQYTVLWRATSSDGHPVDGTLTFTATAATRAPAPTSPPTTTAPAPTSTAPTATASSGTSTTTTPGEAATAAGTDAAPVSAESDAGGPSWPLWAGAGALVVLLAAAAAWLVRRGRTPTP